MNRRRRIKQLAAALVAAIGLLAFALGGAPAHTTAAHDAGAPSLAGINSPCWRCG